MAFVVKLLVNIIYLGVCVGLVAIIISQQGKTQSLGALTGQASTDTYWAKNKGRSKEGRLRTATIVLTVLFFALSIFLNTGIVD
ncbi:MAG: preprotein translocase subunit SecG [Butyrivibrio sp.]|uniref:preprotein translocase subunit SecG n=1 Tax=Butyrivibrio sp. TaxID=28121 RepID=UPI0025F35931|nr:preprotein translocase subunit SecG [Butyrivibrio sp.]MCR5773315.1 preprotein translocase subunit SecG [Butyrivibrio sp.]